MSDPTPPAYGWQPIETAPDNESIFVFIPNTEHYGAGVWRAIHVNMGTGHRWHMTSPHRGHDLGPDYPPTHWMPLPAAPEANDE